ncbi:ALG6, ALG8 glycosyltransferase, partial [Nadsonia fulvescens var. elongata DSM 6958]
DTPFGFFLKPFRSIQTQFATIYVIVSFALILRAAIGLGSYSGFQSLPMHGDFEAQRHWMEITNHLPIKSWYFYDLQWWGLDYPPLTAFHSWLCGWIGRFFFQESWFALDSSRGLDDADLKSFMRGTVLFSELLIYVPSVISYTRWASKSQRINSINQSIIGGIILFQPALMLIDHGHFQYNSVMLGLFLLSIVYLTNNSLIAGSVFFVFSLCFKQMALYYSPVIFAYLLGLCFFPEINFTRLIGIGITVVATFAVILFPFFWVGGVEQLLQIIARVFPFQRGLWEDKVANFWCTANVFIKLKLLFPAAQLQLFSLMATLIAIIPPMAVIFFKPKKNLLIWAFSACSWAFFLFSFQVHEKSVLVPLLPTTLLLTQMDPASSIFSIVCWINNIAVFSLYPLLKRENLRLQYFVILFFWNWLIGNITVSWSRLTNFVLPSSLFWKLIIVGSYSVCAVLHIAEACLPVPSTLLSKYPDLWVVLNVLVCFGCFTLFWLWNLWKLWKLR